MMLNGSGSDLFQVAFWERTKSADAAASAGVRT
jgi:hypothetical protein